MSSLSTVPFDLSMIGESKYRHTMVVVGCSSSSVGEWNMDAWWQAHYKLHAQGISWCSYQIECKIICTVVCDKNSYEMISAAGSLMQIWMHRGTGSQLGLLKEDSSPWLSWGRITASRCQCCSDKVGIWSCVLKLFLLLMH